MTFSTLLQALQKRWVIALLVFASIGLLITIVLRIFTPQQIVIPKTEFVTTNPSGSVSSFSNIRFAGNFIAPTSTLPLVILQPSQTTLDYVRSQIITRYNLTQVQGISGLWRGEEYTLSYNEIGDDFSLYKNADNHGEEEVPLNDVNGAMETAQAFVQETFPNLELTLQRDRVVYVSSLHEMIEVSREEARGLEMPFSYAINGIPVYFNHNKRPPILVYAEGDAHIQKIVFQPHFYTVQPTTQTLVLIDVATALENINTKNEASIISASNEFGQFSLAEIESGELTTVQLEYRVPQETGYAYPFYRFTGELINQDGRVINAQIITPAVAVQEENR